MPKNTKDKVVNVNSNLAESHKEAPISTTQHQLEDYRSGEKPMTMEGLLEAVRKEVTAELTEGKLNSQKGLHKHRNEEAYKGDFSKLEQQRVAKAKNEDEKYEPSAKYTKETTWWDNAKNERLKLASLQKKAQWEDEDEEEEDLRLPSEKGDLSMYDMGEGVEENSDFDVDEYQAPEGDEEEEDLSALEEYGLEDEEDEVLETSPVSFQFDVNDETNFDKTDIGGTELFVGKMTMYGGENLDESVIEEEVRSKLDAEVEGIDISTVDVSINGDQVTFTGSMISPDGNSDGNADENADLLTDEEIEDLLSDIDATASKDDNFSITVLSQKKN